MQNSILEAKKQGFTDDELVDYLSGTNSEISNKIKKAKNSYFSSSEILSNLTGLSSEELNQYEPERGIGASFKRGLSHSTSGILAGQGDSPNVKDNTVLQHLSELAGGVIGDLPAMWAGGEAGALAGGAVGSFIPGAGTVAGAAVGATSGAFALPTLIKETYEMYKKHSQEGFNGTYGEFLSDIGNIVKGTGKSATLGAIVGQAGKLIPILRRTPKLAKLLDTKIGAKLEEPLAEILALTGGETIIERKLPNPSEIAENALVIGGFRAVKGIKGKVTEGIAKSPEDVIKSREKIRKKLDKNAERDEVRSENAKEYTKSLLKKLNSMFPEKVKIINEKFAKNISDTLTKKNDIARKERTKEYFSDLEEHLGEQRAETLKSQLKWREELEKPRDIEGKKRKFTDKELEDMIYYRQKTGNPNLEGDSFETLSKRLPKEAKIVVDTVIDTHLKDWRKKWNESPAQRKIVEKEDYLHGVYETESKQTMQDTIDKMSEKMTPEEKSKFKTEGAFLNPKEYENYKEAFEKAGLKPRFNNIKDLLSYYDNMMIRTMANSKLSNDIQTKQAEGGQKFIVNSEKGQISDEYKAAKKQGFVEFNDPFLRTVFKDGKPQYKSELPALVDPEFAKVFQGVFQKKKGSPQSVGWDYYDNINSLMKISRVSLSPFHIIALAESAVGGMGAKDFISGKWWKEGSKAFEDVEKLAWRTKQGLTFNIPDAESFEKGNDILNKYSKDMEKKSIFTDLAKVPAKIAKKSHDWIFKEYQPRLKIATFDMYLDKVVKEKIKKGETVTPEMVNDIAKEVARTVNNQFGGQIPELITTMNYNDPNTRKWIRRLAGYPDWGISALRQATDAFAPGIRGNLSRNYWLKYLSNWMMATYAMRFIFGGFENDKDKQSIKWNPKKAFSSIENSEPNAMVSFPLPDIDMEIAGIKFNPGKDERTGRKFYSHFGKQALEIPRYVTDPVDALFGKSSPVIQTAFKQMIGGTPYKGELFPVRGKYAAGKFTAWDGSKPGTFKRAKARTISFIGDFIPFSLRGLDDKGLATTVASGMGAVPVVRGLSLYAAETRILDAIRSRDAIKLNSIRVNLKDNGYSDTQIKSRIKQVRKFYKDNENNILFN